MGIQRFVNNCAEQLMARRNVLLGFFLLVTLALGYSATPVRLDPGFNKQIPVRHAYMLNFLDFSRIFTGANRLLVNVWARSSCFRAGRVVQPGKTVGGDRSHTSTCMTNKKGELHGTHHPDGRLAVSRTGFTRL